MRQNTKLFLKSFYISSLVVFCMLFSFFAMGKAYENIRFIAFGENKTAVEYNNGILRVFDFEINIKNQLK